MSNYVKSTNFATKDTLPSGNPLKIVRGTEIDTEFNNIAVAVNSKSDSISPTFTGTVTVAALTASGTATFNGSAVLSGFTSSTAIVNIGSGQVYKDVSGNLGIGTTSPATKLDVFGPGGVTSFTGTSWLGMRVRGASSTNDYSGIDFSTQGQGTPTARIGAIFGASGSSIQFGTSNSYGSGITNTALTINPSGNVNIGATTPLSGARFVVVGGIIQLSGGTTAQSGVRVQEQSGVATLTGINNDNNAYNPLAFYTSASESLRLRTDGSLWTNANAQPGFFARAWVNFDGTLSSPITARASANVSSVTKTATGDYTINFTTAMPDANYVCVGSNSSFASSSGVPSASGGNNIVTAFNTPTSTSSIRVVTMYSTGSPGAFDTPAMMCAFFR